jgi:hypothetical protein
MISSGMQQTSVIQRRLIDSNSRIMQNFSIKFLCEHCPSARPDLIFFAIRSHNFAISKQPMHSRARNAGQLCAIRRLQNGNGVGESIRHLREFGFQVN